MGSNWQIYALGSAFFAGLTAVLAKVGVSGISSNAATLIRTLVITVFLLMFVTFRHEWINPLTMDRKSLLFLVLSAVATGFSWLLYFRALQIGNASLVSSLDKLSLPITVILSILFLGEHLLLWQWIGVGLMVSGAFLIGWK
jgi:transporter family protein